MVLAGRGFSAGSAAGRKSRLLESSSAQRQGQGPAAMGRGDGICGLATKRAANQDRVGCVRRRRRSCKRGTGKMRLPHAGHCPRDRGGRDVLALFRKSSGLPFGRVGKGMHVSTSGKVTTGEAPRKRPTVCIEELPLRVSVHSDPWRQAESLTTPTADVVLAAASGPQRVPVGWEHVSQSARADAGGTAGRRESVGRYRTISWSTRPPRAGHY